MSPRHGDGHSSREGKSRTSAQKGIRRQGASRRHAWRDDEDSRGRRRALRSQDDERDRLWDDEEDEEFDVVDEDEDVEDSDAEDSDEEGDDWYLSRWLGRNRLQDDYDDDN